MAIKNPNIRTGSGVTVRPVSAPLAPLVATADEDEKPVSVTVPLPQRNAHDDALVAADRSKQERGQYSSPGISIPAPNPPHPAVNIPSANTSPTPSNAPVLDSDLPSILRRLNPIQRAKLRSAAMAEGVIQAPTGARENSDGSISVMIRVNPDLVPQIRTWSEEAGKSFEEQTRELVDQLLASYLCSPQAPLQAVGPDGQPVQ